MPTNTCVFGPMLKTIIAYKIVHKETLDTKNTCHLSILTKLNPKIPCKLEAFFLITFSYLLICFTNFKADLGRNVATFRNNIFSISS